MNQVTVSILMSEGRADLAEHADHADRQSRADLADRKSHARYSGPQETEKSWSYPALALEEEAREGIRY